MGIVIVSSIVLIVGIILITLGNKLWSDLCNGFGVGCVMIAGFALLLSLAFTLIAQIPKQKDYETALYERQVIEYRLENKSENVVGNELLYEDIVEYNNTLRSHKRYHDNFWLNWFYNDKIATIEYIEIEGVENYKDWGELWQNKD